jgi:hypothetical protein
VVTHRCRRLWTASFLLLFIFSTRAEDTGPAPDLVLHGIVRGAQNHTYVEVPFHVPAGVERVTLRFTYTGREQHTALDLGLLDPAELRCWSGGNKSVLTLGISDATPSCLPGLITAGEWNVLIGVPNLRSAVTAQYTAEIWFTRTGQVSAEPYVLRAPLRTGAGWYRGDLHMHTAHSDGQCPSQSGQLVPCPVFFTVDAAARRGLDFIAVTDHNATSQYDVMRELQPYFDKVLLIPGREITTFQGHLNFLGTTDFLDFRLGSRSVPNLNVLLRNAQRLGALVSINHPAAPSAEICMGCGFTPAQLVDLHLLNAIEAVNGGTENPAFSGIPFWEHQLSLGHRLTAIGGSDNHRPMIPLDQPGAIGRPTTVVYAAELSTPAILAGIRAGRVFVDLTGSRDRILDAQARDGAVSAAMGGNLRAAAGDDISLDAEVVACPGTAIQWTLDGGPSPLLPPQAVAGGDATLHATWKADGQRHWLLAEVLDDQGHLLLLGNPIYINWEAPSPTASGAR